MRSARMRAALSVVVLCLFVSAEAGSTELTATLEFEPDQLSLRTLDGYDVVGLEGTMMTWDEGRPELPVKLVRFALPRGTRAVRAEARVVSQTTLAGDFSIRPRQPEIPLSMPQLEKWREPDEAIYGSATPYPRILCELLGNGNAGGQELATVAVYPVRYTPAYGRLSLATELQVVLSLEPAGDRKSRPGIRSERANRAAALRLESLVVNPEGLADASARSGRGDVDYLIITSSTYEPTFQELADWKEQKGLTTEVVTTSWIYSNYMGVDNQDQIRNCIIDYYQNHGTLWVLLGGDTTVVPARTVYAMTSGTGGAPDEDRIRCDLYYADLDGTWDADGNGIYGQNSTDEVDMYADLFVGRAPVDTGTEAERFVHKVLTYEGAPGGDPLPTDYQEDMLFMAEVLWTNPWTDHAICKNMIDDESVPEQFDPITKLYQTSGNLSSSTAVAEMNKGYNIVNHNGHANTTVLSIGSSSLYRSHFDNLTNAPRFGLFYSMGCWSAAIDYDCIAEHWVNSPNGGGAAYIGNSRYGWGSPGNPGGGTGDLFDREFFGKLFVDGLYQAGAAHAAHKDEFVEAARSNGYVRYTLYELNLLGDPETTIWTHNPTTATVGHPSRMPLGSSTVLVTVSGAEGPVAGATVYLHNDEVSRVATTGEDGVATLSLAPSTEGSLTLTVTGQGVLPYSGAIDIIDQPADTEAPERVTGLSLADPFDTGGVILVDWTAYPPPSDFAQYRVYRETESFSDVTGLTPIASGLLDAGVREWVDTGAENKQDYHYAVTAVDLFGNERTGVRSRGPIAASVNSRVLLWDADDGDEPFDGSGDEYSPGDGTETPWVEALDSIGELYTVCDSLPDDLEPFELIIYLGGVVNFGDGGLNILMTDGDAGRLTTFVDEGGDLYVEEPMFGGTYYVNGTATTIELWSRFHASYATGATMSEGNVQSAAGQSGRVSQDMTFDYDYQSLSDQLVGKVGPNGDPGSSLLWTDQGQDERGALYIDPVSGSRRYMVPLLLGAMTDASSPSTRLEYVTRILEDSDLIGTAGADDGEFAKLNVLGQNAPNPFNPITRIAYTVGAPAERVTLSVYDVSGRLVASLVNGPLEAGDYVSVWDGRDSEGRAAASGVYFSRLSVDGWSATRKMVLLK